MSHLQPLPGTLPLLSGHDNCSLPLQVAGLQWPADHSVAWPSNCSDDCDLPAAGIMGLRSPRCLPWRQRWHPVVPQLVCLSPGSLQQACCLYAACSGPVARVSLCRWSCQGAHSFMVLLFTSAGPTACRLATRDHVVALAPNLQSCPGTVCSGTAFKLAAACCSCQGIAADCAGFAD